MFRMQWGFRGLRGHRCRITSFHIKRSAFSSARDDGIERLKIACGSSGSITVDLYNTQALSNPSTPLVLYLPPTGSHLRDQHPQIPSCLFQPDITLARVNYRWNIPEPVSIPGASPSPEPLSSHPSFARHPFPTPLHDIFHTYNYLVDSVLPRYAPPPSPPPSTSTRRPYSAPPAFPRLRTIQRPIILYGSFLSGPIATSIALTESRNSPSSPVKLAGLIVKNGIFDFSPLALTLPKSANPDESPEQEGLNTSNPDEPIYKRPEPGHGPWDRGWTHQLLDALKTKLFAKAESTFDSFASPVFFFRTSGAHVPKLWPGEEAEKATATASEEDVWIDGFEGFDEHGQPIFSSKASASQLKQTPEEDDTWDHGFEGFDEHGDPIFSSTSSFLSTPTSSRPSSASPSSSTPTSNSNSDTTVTGNEASSSPPLRIKRYGYASKAPPTSPASSSTSPSSTLSRSFSTTAFFSSSSPTSPSPSNEDPASTAPEIKVKRYYQKPSPTGKVTTELDLDPPPRKSHLKFPPTNSDLVIPPTLFLYTSPPSPSPHSSSSSNTSKRSQASKQASKSAKKSKTLDGFYDDVKQELGLGGMNPKSQAMEMRGLMTRSIVLHEFNHKEGRIWDEDSGHPREVAESRVRLAEVGPGGDVRGFGGDYHTERETWENGDEERLVEDWLDEILGR
ncbi:uncharacterized protein PAC_02269 [Phialocephala subalpina]|uniref:Uncharacterized protein n=1 Tax=Phialocephala subalpina TaxID=576137 RepID=A0A1L7WI13_9HELO|nr:uncharacterized protein PAC_02269 [Phialocephala subalpina]